MLKKVLIEGGKAVLLIIFILGLVYGLMVAKDREKPSRFPVKSEIEKLWNLA